MDAASLWQQSPQASVLTPDGNIPAVFFDVVHLEKRDLTGLDS